MSSSNIEPNDQSRHSKRRRLLLLAALLAVVALATFGVTALLVTIFEHARRRARRSCGWSK